MPQRLSRRKIAAYYAQQLVAGNSGVAKQLAAYLIETRRVREADLIVRDIESALADRGVLLAGVASSRSLSDTAVKQVTAYLTAKTGASKVHLRQTVEPELLGGVRITTPGGELDATLRHRLNQLKASKI